MPCRGGLLPRPARTRARVVGSGIAVRARRAARCARSATPRRYDGRAARPPAPARARPAPAPAAAPPHPAGRAPRRRGSQTARGSRPAPSPTGPREGRSRSAACGARSRPPAGQAPRPGRWGDARRGERDPRTRNTTIASDMACYPTAGARPSPCPRVGAALLVDEPNELFADPDGQHPVDGQRF